MEHEFFGFIQQELHNLDKDSIFQLLQSHGRINDYCLQLAKKFENYEETLVVHSINSQDFKSALKTIDSISDPELRFDLTLKYGLALSKEEPLMYIRSIQKQSLSEK